jgi:molybdopterin converting factor small subunit
MKVSVLFHSYFRDLTGCSKVTLELPEGASLAHLVSDLQRQFPKLKAMEKSTLIAVGVEYQSRDYILRDGDEVSLFPPVQGG